ncbi:amidohydrolase [Acidithiobacillus thiooxidans]|uniref:M20 metallopeptidase family protein n=1 Tax=Acidithiobacillus thiooxidans TaxID=930 RepID=UPI002863FF2D|nr:amidohydrolase [Acidithiobacillus thiooxidans]MDR7926784.1 amidohydrolase [Acidithiobacillus thiooxidans]
MNMIIEEGFHEKVTGWRRHIHQRAELSNKEFETALYITAKLNELGLLVTTGVGGTGVMAKIEGNQPGPVIGIRADMDGLPIKECNTIEYKSINEGVMHACGHDGHTAILLGAAEKLSKSRNFRGTVILIFQPAEEDGAGARAMLLDPKWNDFGIEKIYGLHNIPQIKLGYFALIDGPCMASEDVFSFRINSNGGHAAYPHLSSDIISATSTLVFSISGLSRRICPASEPIVVTVTQIHSGNANNIIPSDSFINGTVRCFSKKTRMDVQSELENLGQYIGKAFRLKVKLDYESGYPVTYNHKNQVEELKRSAIEAGLKEVDNFPQLLGSEDFSYFTEVLPSAYLFLGSGDEFHTNSLHSCQYDFNDGALTFGVKLWLSLLNNVS